MVSFTAELASDKLSTSRKQRLNWKVANRIAVLLDLKPGQCRRLATQLIKDKRDSWLFNDFQASKKFATNAMKKLNDDQVTTQSAPVATDEVEYQFDYSLVQKVAELSKENGYDNVMAALKLYNKLMKGL